MEREGIAAIGEVAGPRTAAIRNADRPNALYTVRAGDTLSHIVAARLRMLGREVTREAIYQGVEQVAARNSISDPDRIYAGDRIDVSILNVGVGVSVQGGASAMPGRLYQAVAKSVSVRGSEAMRRRGDANKANSVLGAPARVTSGFGQRDDPFGGGGRYHGGIDLAAAPGTAVYPMAPGVVVESGWRGDYGYAVTVRHADGTESLYGHNERNLVRAGERVAETTPLAVVGSTGRATGPHLHFEVRRNGTRVDPLPYLRGLRAYREAEG